MAKVRFLKEGGNPNDPQEEQKDENLLAVGDMQLDRSRLTNTFRNFDDFGGWANNYKGLSGNKIQNAVASRAREIANGVLKGEVSLQDLTTFTSQNQEFESDGKTKKRFLGGYDSKDNNTVNAIAARYVLDVMNRSKYNKPVQQEVVEEKEELPEYDWDYASGMLGKTDSDKQAAIAGLATLADKNKRLGVISKWFGNAYANIAKDRESGRYSDKTDWNQYEKYAQIQDWLKDEATYNNNKENILTVDARIAGVIANLLGEGQNGQVPQEDLEYQEELKKNEQFKKKQDYENLKRENQFNEYHTNTWNSLRTDGIPYVVSHGTQGNSDDFKKIYSKSAYTQGEDGSLKINDEYKRYIEDVIGDIYKGYNENIVAKGLVGNKDAESKFWKANYDKKDKYLNEFGANIRENRLAQYTTILNSIGYGNGAIPTTYDNKTNTILAMYNGKLTQMNLKQAVANGVITRKQADDLLRESWNRENGYLKTGGIIAKAQLGMRMQALENSSLSNPDESVLNFYKTYAKEQADLKAEQEAAILAKQQNEEDVRRRVKEKKGTLTSKEAKEAVKNNTNFEAKDWARVAAAAANMSSAIAGLTGLSPLSAGLGVVGTISNATADKLDDSVSTGEWWGNLGVNLGLDALSLIPFAGTAAAGTKIMRVTRSIMPVLGAFAIANTDFAGTYNLAKKLVTNGWKSMSKQEWADLMNGVSQLSGVARTGANARSAMKTRANAAAASGKSLLRVKGPQGMGHMEVTNDQWTAIQNAAMVDGKRLKGNKAISAQKKMFNEIFGNDIELAETRPLKDGKYLPSNARQVYDYSDPDVATAPMRYTMLGEFINPVSGNRGNASTILEATKRNPRGKRFVADAQNDVHNVEVERPTGMLSRARNKRKDIVDKGKDKVRQITNKPLPQGKVEVDGSKYMRKTVGGKTRYYKHNDNKGYYEEIVNPDKSITKYEYKRNGGRLVARRFASGGIVRKYQNGGDTVRNTYTNNEPADFKKHLDLWGRVMKPAIIEEIAGLKSDDARRRFIKGNYDIQEALRDTRNASGVGYGQDVIKKTTQAFKHQQIFDDTLRRGNEQIEKAYRDGLIYRRGNTGDNAAGGWRDGFHGNANALRTTMVTGSKEEDDLFRNSKDYQEVREIAAMRNMTYLPLKELSDENTKYYGTSEMPKLNPNPTSLSSMVGKPEIPTTLPVLNLPSGKPTNVTDNGSDISKNDGKVETNPTNLKKRGTGGGFNGAGLLDLIDPIAGTIINNRAVRKAQDGLRPDLVDAYRTQVPVENDYWAKRNAEETAARYNRFGYRAANETADAALGNAMQLSTMSRAEDAIRQGNDTSRQHFYATRGQAMEAENANTARWTQASNVNRGSMNRIKALKANMEANRITGNYTGIWQPWMREKKANALMAGKLRQAQEAQLYNMDQSEKFKSQLATASRESTQEGQYQWLQTDDGRKWYNEFQQERLKGSPSYKSSSNYVRASDYFPIFARKGGRVRSSYSMNLGLDTFTKEFFKTERSAKNVGVKERIASTSGIRLYAKDAAQNITDYNKMISYARKKK